MPDNAGAALVARKPTAWLKAMDARAEARSQETGKMKKYYVQVGRSNADSHCRSASERRVSDNVVGYQQSARRDEDRMVMVMLVSWLAVSAD